TVNHPMSSLMMNRMFGCFCCLPFAFAMFKNLMIHRSVLCHSIFIKYFFSYLLFFNRYEFYCASQRQLSKGRMRPIGGRNHHHCFYTPMNLVQPSPFYYMRWLSILFSAAIHFHFRLRKCS